MVDLPAEDAVSEVHQVVEVTASAQQPEQQTRACELVLVPLGDDAREEVSRSVDPHAQPNSNSVPKCNPNPIPPITTIARLVSQPP